LDGWTAASGAGPGGSGGKPLLLMASQ